MLSSNQHQREHKRQKEETYTCIHPHLLPVCSQSWGDVPSWNLGDYVSPEEGAVNHPNSFWIPVKFCFLKDRKSKHFFQKTHFSFKKKLEKTCIICQKWRKQLILHWCPHPHTRGPLMWRWAELQQAPLWRWSCRFGGLCCCWPCWR